MEFKLDGKSIIPNMGLSPVHIIKKLNKLKDGELYSTSKLTDLLGVSGGYIRDIAKSKLPKNCIMAGGRYFWGSEKTISAYKAKLNE